MAKNYLKSSDTEYLSDIVAFIDGSPVYMAEVVFMQKRAAVEAEIIKCSSGNYNNETKEFEYSEFSQQMIKECYEKANSFDSAFEEIKESRAIEKEAKRLGTGINEDDVRENTRTLENNAEYTDVAYYAQWLSGTDVGDIYQNMLDSFEKSKTEMLEALHIDEEQYYSTYELSRNTVYAYYNKFPEINSYEGSPMDYLQMQSSYKKNLPRNLTL